MNTASIKKFDGGTASIDSTSLDSLKSSLRGKVILPGEEGFDQSRTIWNAMIDRRPGLVIRCAGVSDIQKAALFAREHSLLTAIRGGGHNIAG
ncbi:MAG: FAD-linked oxidase, partial [Candidatus Zixiibacteriota bacterium]